MEVENRVILTISISVSSMPDVCTTASTSGDPVPEDTDCSDKASTSGEKHMPTESNPALRILRDHPGHSMALIPYSRALSKEHLIPFGGRALDIVLSLRARGRVRYYWDEERDIGIVELIDSAEQSAMT